MLSCFHAFIPRYSIHSSLSVLAKYTYTTWGGGYFCIVGVTGLAYVHVACLAQDISIPLYAARCLKGFFLFFSMFSFPICLLAFLCLGSGKCRLVGLAGFVRLSNGLSAGLKMVVKCESGGFCNWHMYGKYRGRGT